ncbi:MAG: TlpA family protein disulfide reductase [Labilithrix sp.]|nr:TlpA family protein disulfide reductase [Labilithrix sp.]MCW5818191.1 TlpA family protein disulfide reductase [Labilithrix sp.]
MASRRTLLIALLLLVSGCAATAAPAARPATLPQASLRALDRGGQDLASALGGRPALLALWATWCDACQKERPDLEKLDAWSKEHGGVVVSVAVGEPVDKVKTFATEHRVPYAVLVDEDFQLADALGEKRVPATLVVDKSGRIVHTAGALDERSVAEFRRLVGAAPVP